jgi:hypothetical protein
MFSIGYFPRVRIFFIQPLKMDLTEGSETSAKLIHPAFEDGPDRGFRNVGKTYSSSSLEDGPDRWVRNGGKTYYSSSL